VSKIKNSLLDLDSTDYDIIMEKLSQLSILPSTKPPKVFVLTFKGDVMASQVSRLREEITAILNVCDKERGDRVVLQLNSGGGTVTGYGLASAQLQRLRDVGLPLVVCIDEVAASGGYMMASVADYIIASPFAVVGSVGVIATVPNFSERLQREGVVVEDITAGKYKRTLTPYKKPNEEDRSKMKSDIEHVLVLFKSFLKSNRPMLNVDAIATGETWQGPDALKRGLVDELRTTDSYLSDLYNSGHDVLTVAIKPVAPRFSDVMEDDQHTQGSLFTWAQSWLAQVFQGAIEMALRSSTNGLNLDLNRKHDASTPVWRLEDGDDVDDMMAMTNRNAGTARTFRERIMMVYDQNKNPPML
jgi:signal peptide peptidase SppA